MKKEVAGYKVLADKYKELHGGTAKDADVAIRSTMETISECLKDDMVVRFVGMFSLEPIVRAGRKSTLPDGRKIESEDFKTIKLKISPELREELNA